MICAKCINCSYINIAKGICLLDKIAVYTKHSVLVRTFESNILVRTFESNIPLMNLKMFFFCNRS